MITSYQQGKTQNQIVLEYELTPSTLVWIIQYITKVSFKTKDSISTEDYELLVHAKK